MSHHKQRDRPVWIGLALTIGLLAAFVYFNTQYEVRAAFKLPTAWIAVTMVPLAIGILLSNKISSLKFGGFEAVLNQPLNQLDQQFKIIVAEVAEATETAQKDNLRLIIAALQRRPERLVLRVENAHRYNSLAILQYVIRIPTIRFVEITYHDQFLLMYPVDEFLSSFDREINQAIGDTTVENSLETLTGLLESLKEPMIIEHGQNTVYGRSNSAQLLFTKGIQESARYDSDFHDLLELLNANKFVPILDRNGMCIGVVTWDSVGKTLAKLIIRKN